jgi:hypothetical protein
VTLTVPVTAPGPHGADELALEPVELLEPLELPQHMPELELLLELLDDVDVMELTLEPELPLDPALLELPHERAGLSRRAARRCRPNADAS